MGTQALFALCLSLNTTVADEEILQWNDLGRHSDRTPGDGMAYQRRPLGHQYQLRPSPARHRWIDRYSSDRDLRTVCLT